MVMKADIRLGNQVEDVVTGFRGIVVTRLEKLNGTAELGVVPEASKTDGKYPDINYLPAEQLKKIGDGVLTPRANASLGFRARAGDA